MALLTVVACSSCTMTGAGRRHPDGATITEIRPPTTRHVLAATGVWGLVSGKFGADVLGQAPESSGLVVSKSATPRSIVVVFPLAPTRVDCLYRATIDLEIGSVQGRPEVNAYPAADFRAAAQGGAAISTRVLDVAHKASGGSVGKGRLLLDAGDLYASWIEGFREQTGTGHKLVPAGTPLVTVLRRPDDTDGAWSFTLKRRPTITYEVADSCPSRRRQAELLPGTGPPAGEPLARPRPTAADVLRAVGSPVDVESYRREADLDGESHADYVWGDVENYQSGQAYFDEDAVVLRIVGLTDRKHRVFSIAAFDVATGLHAPLSQNGGGRRPTTWTWDDPRTPWAD